MRARAVLVFALSAPLVAGGDAARADAMPPAEASAHAKRCAVIAKGSRDYRVRARIVTCRFAVRWSRAFLRSGSRPRGYACSRPGGGIALYCRKGDRTYWAERLGRGARAAHPGHGPSQVIVGAAAISPGSSRSRARTPCCGSGTARTWTTP